MAATITATSSRITISGNYKAFTCGAGNTTTVINYASGNVPASSDANGRRFLMWKNGANTANWQIRFIESATSSTVTVGDGGFSTSPSSGSNFVISTSLADIQSAVSSACTVSGKSYSFNGRDWLVTNGAFLADVDVSLDMEHITADNGWQASTNCAVQFGRLTGGEANNSTITRQGCYLSLDNTRLGNGTNVFGTGGSELSNGPIFNFYGCYIKSYTNTPARWAFVRGSGPIRMIGTIWDGEIGGAFYHSASELVDTKFRGNTNLTTAWSIRATFVRPVSKCEFANGLAAFKTFSNYTGIFRDTVFDLDSLGTAVFVQGSTTGGVTCIDSTTFPDANITDSGDGFAHQAKSINYTVTDANGTGLTGAKVAVYDTEGTLQGSIQTSSSGAVGEIVATFFKWQDSSPSANKAPFDIRVRLDSYVYLGFQSAVSEPIKQELRLSLNSQRVDVGVDAAAITGISLDFATETLTLTEDRNTQKLYDYYQYQLFQDAQMQYGEDLIRTGNSFDLDDWDMVVDGCTYTGDATTTGTISLINGGFFNGTRTDQNGTVLPFLPVTGINIVQNSRVKLFNVTKSITLDNSVVTGTGGYSITVDPNLTTVDIGDTLRLEAAYQSGTTAKKQLTLFGVLTSSGLTFIDSQEDLTDYASLGVDGSTVTEYNLDPNTGHLQIDAFDADCESLKKRIVARYYYLITTADGIDRLFGIMFLEDAGNAVIRRRSSGYNLMVDNTGNCQIVLSDSDFRLYTDDGSTWILSPSTGGYGFTSDSGRVNIAKQKEIENKVQKLVDAENADIFVTPTRFTKKIAGTETVILEKTYTTDGQGTESLTEVT